MAHTSTGTEADFWNLANQAYCGNSSRTDAAAQPAPQGRRIVSCKVCFLYPTNPELDNTPGGYNGMIFCWPCTGRRLNTIVPGGSRHEHEDILWQVNYIRSRSEAWRLEVDSTAEGAALRVVTANAQLQGIEDASERMAYIFSNIREFLVLLSQKIRLKMRVYNVLDVPNMRLYNALDVPIQSLDDMALVGLTGCLRDNREAFFRNNSLEFANGEMFTPPESCANPRDGWSSCSNLG